MNAMGQNAKNKTINRTTLNFLPEVCFPFKFVIMFCRSSFEDIVFSVIAARFNPSSPCWKSDDEFGMGGGGAIFDVDSFLIEAE